MHPFISAYLELGAIMTKQTLDTDFWYPQDTARRSELTEFIWDLRAPWLR